MDPREKRVHGSHHRSGKARTQAHRAAAATSGADVTAGPEPDTETQPFQAVMNDVLPKERQSDGGQAAPEASAAPPQISRSSIIPDLTAPASALANPSGAVRDEIQAAMVTTDTVQPVHADDIQRNAEGGNISASQPAATTKLALPPELGNRISEGAVRIGPRPNAAEPGEVAFAARIAQRVSDTRATAPGDAQSVIAAARFEGLASGSDWGKQQGEAGRERSAAPGVTLNKTAAGNSNNQPDQTKESSTPGAWDGPANDTGARAAVGAPYANSRSASAQASLSSDARDALDAKAGTGAGSGTRNETAGMAAAAAPGSGTAGSSSPASAKAATQTHGAQFLEAPNDAVEHTGQSVRDISLNFSSKDQSNVQVRLSERAGELHVSVRSSDGDLTRGLRDGLSDLVGRLEHSGYRAETWQPADSHFSGGEHDSPSQDPSSQQHSGGSQGESGRQQNSRDQQQSEAQTPQWASELESNMQRSNRSWQPSSIR